MTRRVLSEPLPGGGYITKAWSATESEAAAVEAACRSVPPARAFTPGLCAGEPFDPPEFPPPEEVPPNSHRVVSECGTKLEWRLMPPPCDGPPSGYAEDAGIALAIAQHEAACDGDGCDGAACLLTRGSD